MILTKNKKSLFKNGKKAFTLVELIVAVSIIAILSTLGIVSFKSYMKDTRDGSRLASFVSIKSGLELYNLQTGKFPMPDVKPGESIVSTGGLSISGTIYNYSYLGVIGDNVSKNIKLPSTPTDPLTSDFYLYGVTNDFKSYQVSGIYEGELANNNIFYKNAYASNSSYTAQVIGNFKTEVIFKTNSGQYLTIVPSLLYDKSGSNILNGTGTLSIVNKKSNLPYTPIGFDSVNVLKAKDLIKDLKGTNADLITLKLPTQDELRSFTGSSLINYFTSNSSYDSTTILASLGAYNNGNINYSLVENIVKGSISSSSQFKNCTSTTYSGYLIPSLSNNESKIQTKPISNGTGSTNVTCNNGTLLYGTENISCSINYVLNNGTCVQDICTGNAPANSQVNGSQKYGVNWSYNTVAGSCTFVCQLGYYWNGSNCTAASAGNYVGSTGLTSQTACTTGQYQDLTGQSSCKACSNKPSNSTYTSSTALTSNTCPYSCDSGYYGSGGSCLSYVNGACTGIPSNAVYYNNSTSYTLTNANNGTSLSASYNAVPTTNTCQFKCNSSYTWNGSNACTLSSGYFSGAGTSGEPYRLSSESSSSITVSAINCNYYNTNATTLNNGNSRGTGTCGNGSQGCLSDGVYLIDPDGANTFVGANTKLFINSNTSNGNTTFTDSATSKSITRYGDAINSTAQKTFGTSSMYFDGSGDYLSLADSDDWYFGSGDFTIDMFINPSITQPDYSNLYSQFVSDSQRVVLDWGISGRLRFTDGTTDYFMSGSQTWNVGQWYHIAIVKNSSGLRFYKDGILQNSTNISTSVNIQNISAPLMIGGQTTYSRYFNGYIQNVRITKGEALRTSNFNPPMQAMNVYCDMTNDSGGWTLVSVGKSDNFADPAFTTAVGTTISPSQASSSKFSDYQMVALNGSKSRVLLGDGTKYYVKYSTNAWAIQARSHGSNPIPSCSYDGNSWVTGRQYHVGDCCGSLGSCNSPIHSIFNTYPWYPSVSGLDGRYGGTLWIK